MSKSQFQWAVIGAGPAGITAVGKLLDSGVSPKAIAWVDPEFRGGDFVSRWGNVPSNTRVQLFQKYLHGSEAFQYEDCSHDFELNHLDPYGNCLLSKMSEPLLWVSERLCKKVTLVKGYVQSVAPVAHAWQIETKNDVFASGNVILAMGSEPKVFDYPGPEVISLADAMNKDILSECYGDDDTIAVFGSSHSAMLAIRNLMELGVKKVINFYREPLRFAVIFDDWILFDDTGLKGSTAEWARKYVTGEMPDNLVRYYSDDDSVKKYLSKCDKVIYAVGFKSREKPIIQGFNELPYNDKCGIIAPGLFGFGIAFPEGKVNPIGILEHRVGLWKFLDYCNRAMPLWLEYPR